jgi:hypothetical protein
LAARADLRMARRAARTGSSERAAELVARAMARVPALPEALYLAGELARLRGEDEIARRWFRAYVDGGADDLGAEEALRAYLASE